MYLSYEASWKHANKLSPLLQSRTSPIPDVSPVSNAYDYRQLRICPENEEFGLCLECEETCGEFYPMCSMGCEGVGCHCKPGFLRYGEICVRPSDCPQDSLSGLLGGGGVEGGYNGFDPDYAYGGYYPGGYGGFPLKSKKKA
uniref:TIL domain-containing protein n=1 Tax=Syphacia muris TaxID=451379 RepID=A0A0N5AS92_9BILA